MIEHALGKMGFARRWLATSLYLGIIGALAMLLVKFVEECLRNES